MGSQGLVAHLPLTRYLYCRGQPTAPQAHALAEQKVRGPLLSPKSRDTTCPMMLDSGLCWCRQCALWHKLSPRERTW